MSQSKFRSTAYFGMLLLSFVTMTACQQSTKTSSKPKFQPGTGEPILVGDLFSDDIAFQFAIYYLPEPTKEPLSELKAILKTAYPDLQLVEKTIKDTKQSTVAAKIDDDPKRSFTPPDLQSLQYFGRGISREQAIAVQDSKKVFILEFAHPKKEVWNGLRSALGLTLAISRATDGLIWDETTRELFSPDEWESRRITDWTEDVPDISKHTVIHAYKKDEFVRAITLGMEKFGLPDLLVEDFSWSLNRNMGHILHLLGQALAEGSSLPRHGEFDLDFRAVKNAKVRDPQMSSLEENATGIAHLALRKGNWEEGDPINRLIEISFERGTGPDRHAKQLQILVEAFGAKDSVVMVKESQDLEDASQKAKTKLPALRAEFNKGLAPGEFIQVKSPFKTPDGGQEMMWVEITSWNGDKITGLLKNQPLHIPKLRGGQMVEVFESEVYDYIRKRADGTTEGNETGKIIDSKRN